MFVMVENHKLILFNFFISVNIVVTHLLCLGKNYIISRKKIICSCDFKPIILHP